MSMLTIVAQTKAKERNALIESLIRELMAALFISH